MKNFKLKGIKSPGTVNLPVVGTFNLEDIDDAFAELLYKQGIPFLEPTPEHRETMYPDQKQILNSPIPDPVKPKKKITR